MRELGYIDGSNIVFDRRFADGDDSLVHGFIADLVRRPVDIIVVTGTREVEAAYQATSSIPIVAFIMPDPITMGVAQSLSRPGRNVTGLTTMDVEIYGKRLELLKQVVPTLKRVGVLISGRQPLYKRDSQWARSFEASAHALGIGLDIVDADETNLEQALATVTARGAQGLVVTSDGVYVAIGKSIAESAIKHRLPAIFAFRQQVRAGGLISYAAMVSDLSRRAAFFVDRILKGARPTDLPIEQPTKFELTINLKTAKLLGLEIPATLLAQANEVFD
jgi:putative ABC transport system substrate-binding protein